MGGKLVLGTILLACLFLVSFPFEQRYGKYMHESAHNPGIQFLAGLGLVSLATIDPLLGGLALLVIFLWIADVQLLSSVKIRI
jgi:hypothetical protein